jgi:quercetin dioxygenase-like cupin family protein
MPDPRVLEPGAGVALPHQLGGAVTFKVRGEETNGALFAFETEVAPGQGPPLHVHANEEEILYVLDGDLRFRYGDDIRDAPRESFIFVPRGVPHTFQNVSDGLARILIVFTPSGMEAFFSGLAEAISTESDPEEAFRASGEAAGMSVVGPPLSVSHP